MFELKKKAVSGIKGMLEDRLSERLKPKKPDEAPVTEETSEAMSEAVGGETDLEAKVSAEGGDLSKLTPEERATLEQLYEKMGC